MNTCTKCKKPKPLSEFGRDLRRQDGVMARCKDCRREECKAWRSKKPNYEKDRYRKDPAGHRERHLVRKYGVNSADYDALLKAQGGACAICGKVQSRAFDVDHDHAGGVVRGLLCTNCNRMIGHAHDSAERLRRAADYLESSRKSQP